MIRAWQILLKLDESHLFALERDLFQNLSTDTPRMLMEDETLRDRDLTLIERRQLWLFVVAIVGMFAIAGGMTPDPRGSGTHQKLGLPPCIIRSYTGMSCPHCGLTTSCCWLVRGEWKRSLEANPAGMLLAVLLGYSGLFSIWIICRNRWPRNLRFGTHVRTLMVVWLMSAVLLWLAEHLSGGS